MTCRLPFLFLLLAHSSIQDCIINELDVIGQFGFEPLYLKRGTLEFIYPLDKTNGSTISVPEDSEILISCGATTLTKTELSIDDTTILAKCNSESQFEMNGTVFQIEDIGCDGNVMEIVTTTGETCANENGVILNVNYPIEFLEEEVPLYEICFDLKTKNVFYSKFISPELANEGNGFIPRMYPSVDNIFYNISDDIYLLYSQYKTNINQQIGLPSESEKYFTQDFSNPLHSVWIRISQDRLSDYVFFFFKNQQYSTSRYMNTVPIWDVYRSDSLNNWEYIRNGLRRFAIENRYELEIYSGTYGVTTLPHEDTLNDIELYLYENEETKALPLAKLLWRLVYHRETKSAIVFVTINNPWFLKDDDKVCTDASFETDWAHYLDWLPTRLDLGYSYACRYEDFINIVDFLPVLEVEGVLNA